MKLVVFDLDGTLIDSVADIAQSVNELRLQWNHNPLPLDTIEGYIGNGVRVLLERSLEGASVAEIERAHELYLEIYRRRLLDNTVPYAGVRPALDELERSGQRLAVLTNKPRRESVMILRGLDLERYFNVIYGGDSFEHKKPDPMGLRHILEEARVSARDALFVGDSRVDFITATSASVRCCLVGYGIRPQAIRSLEPDFRVDDLRELPAIIAGA